MKFGTFISCFRTEWDRLSTWIETLEKGRWHSAWWPDHILTPGRASDHGLPAYEGFASLSVALGMTRKLHMRHLVLGTPYRNPALNCKMAGTLDQASKGRFTLGIGAGWFKREHEAYGWGFPSMKERQDRLQEAAELTRLLFSATEPVTYNGKHYQLDEAPLSPAGYQGRRIEILIGGTGEKRTLKTLAMFGDAMNLDGFAGKGMEFDYYKHKVSILEQHCANVGRDPKEIRHTLNMPIVVTEDQSVIDHWLKRYGPGTVAGSRAYVLDRLHEFEEAGVDEIIIDDMATFAALHTPDVPVAEVVASCQRMEEEIIAAFD